MSSPYGIDVLAFGPHPDDVEIFCGGVVITLASLGYRTGIVDLTRGELSSQGTPEQRAKEAEAGAKVLGAAWRNNLGLPDGFIDGSASSPHLRPVVAALRKHRPELVLVPWNEERHPDHVAASLLITRAVFFAALPRFDDGAGGAPFTPRQVLHYELRHRMLPTFIVDTSSVWDKKAQAIACHQSQVMRQEGGPATLISAPLAIAAVEARDRYRGSEIGVRYGEALRSPQTLGVADPLAFFRTHAFPAAHAFEPAR
ncbi:MAG TPA: bacillithiol biosynthesis deacetylase BshB1 [Candidatus Polarisedimenticolaceae bacterium]|nr:bacillithiol biosynthesis deacetylase BshB1 [Candidatus Polarisedimenticolaceae bacterium]